MKREKERERERERGGREKTYKINEDEIEKKRKA